jgi:polysaccharide pyruvyl transferase WcaK-like protein
LISRRRRRTGRPAPQVGLFGLLGSGNLGNDGSMEAVLAYLRARHPDAVVDALCGGPELVAARHGIGATPLYWYRGEYQTASGASAIAMKGFGKAVDVFRTASWVRRHDAVIVPGMGVLEATLPLRPWATPYSLFLLCAAGRIFGTKVALVSVGANVINERAIRTLVSWAARLASYRSYRDEQSRIAMRTMGVDTSSDEVYPDLAFALPTPPDQPRTGTVGVGVMAYHGANEDREHAEEIYRGYVDKMKRFVRWLVDQGRQVRLFTGDRVDESVVAEILAEFPGSAVTAAPTSSLDELMREMASVDTVVATRYHNVLCALKLCKPTVSVGYAAKNDVLMSDMGLGRFCHPVRQLDVDRLIDQFTELESQSARLRAAMAARNEDAARRLDRQFQVLSAALLPAASASAPAPATATVGPVADVEPVGRPGDVR